MEGVALGVAYIDIIARASGLAKQAQGEVRTALVGSEQAYAASSARVGKTAERELSSGITAGTHRGVRDLERETQGVFRRIHGQAAGFAQSALGIGGKGLEIAAIGLSVGALAKSAIDYQEQTTKLSNSAQITQQQANRIGQAFLHTAGKSQYSAKEMISAYAPIAGVFKTIYGSALTASQSVQFMSAAQHLAEASGQPLASTTKSLSQILLTYHLGLGQASHATDILYNTSRNLGVPLTDITQQFQRLAPRLAGSGTTIGQTAGLFQELAKQVGTGRFALRTAGSAIQQMIEPSSGAKKALSSLGISLTDSHGKFIGVDKAIGLLHNALVKLPGGVAGAAAAQKLQAAAISDSRVASEKLAIQSQLLGLSQQKEAIAAQIAAVGTGKHTKAVAEQLKALHAASQAVTSHEQHLRNQSTAINLSQQAFKLQKPALEAQAAALNKNGLLTALFGRQANIMKGIIAGGVPELRKATEATNAHGTAQKAAEKVAGTLGGRLRTLKATALDMATQLGQKLEPAVSLLITGFTDLLGAVTPTIDFIRSNSTVFEIVGAFIATLAVVMGGAAAATALYSGATAAATAVTSGFRGAMLLLNLVIAANPIFAIVTLVLALAAAFYVAYEKIKPFHDAVDAVGRALRTAFVASLHAVETAVSTVIHFITGHWKLLVPIFAVVLGPIGLVGAAAFLLYRNWKTVWNGMLQVAGFIVGTIIQDVIKPIIGAFLTMAKSIIDSAANAFGWVPGIGGKLKKARHAVDGFVNDTSSTMQGWADSAFSWGDSYGKSLTSGLDKGMTLANSAASRKAYHLSAQVIKNMREAARVSSPSAHTTFIGQMIVEGLARPIEGSLGRLSHAAAKAGLAATGVGTVRFGPVGGAASSAVHGRDGGELLQELRLLRMELTGQRVYFNDLVRETKALPQDIGNVLVKAGDFRYAPRELRA